jgi:hypothetical protein
MWRYLAGGRASGWSGAGSIALRAGRRQVHNQARVNGGVLLGNSNGRTRIELTRYKTAERFGCGQHDAVECEYCHAALFKGEGRKRNGIRAGVGCCARGTVGVLPIRTVPHLELLWRGSSTKANRFKTYARKLNNACSLACARVHDMRQEGNHNPSVIFQGALHHSVGPLSPDDIRPGGHPGWSQVRAPPLPRPGSAGCVVDNS